MKRGNNVLVGYDERPDVALMNQQKTGLTEIK